MKVFLDYDGLSKKEIVKEAKEIKEMFSHLEIEIWKSSRGNYHLKIRNVKNWIEALDILKFSNCSLDYKEFVLRRKAFVIRVSEKIIFRDGKVVKRKMQPKLIMKI